MKALILALMRGYQKYISPVRSLKCPYYPTCSCYGIEAVTEHGPWIGSLLAIWRILRCNPFSKGGYDPVPELKSHRKKITF